MASFKDKAGREWSIQLDALSILKVREESDSRFMLGDESEEDNTCTRLGDDPITLCMVLYSLCEQQVKSEGLDRDTFLRAVVGDGDTIQAAGEALVAAIVNFTQPRKRRLLEAVVKKQRAVEDMGTTMALAKMDDPTVTDKIRHLLAKQMDDAINNALMPPAKPSDLQDLSDSTPAA